MVNCLLLISILVNFAAANVFNRAVLDQDNGNVIDAVLTRSRRDATGMNRLGNTVSQGARHRTQQDIDNDLYAQIMKRYGLTNKSFSRPRRRNYVRRY